MNTLSIYQISAMGTTISWLSLAHFDYYLHGQTFGLLQQYKKNPPD
jgi:hypothetical protein